MYRIGEIVHLYKISHRSLRYWEEVGIVLSTREENGYRYYDDLAVKQIQKIIVFRSLKFPISLIEKILICEETSNIMTLIEQHLLSLSKEVTVLGLIMEYIRILLRNIEDSNDIDQACTMVFELLSQEKLTSLSKKGELDMSKRKPLLECGVRILRIPRLRVASIRMSGDGAEEKCWKHVLRFIQQYDLQEYEGFKNYGFSTADDVGGYQYEMWVATPHHIEIEEPFKGKVFEGGLFAAVDANLGNISEKWNYLYDAIVESLDFELAFDAHHEEYYLEECLDLEGFHNKDALLSNRQLDLLIPIQRAGKTESFPNPTIVCDYISLDDKILAGSYFSFDLPKTIVEKIVPWGKLAGMMYKIKGNFMDCIYQSTLTYSVYQFDNNPINPGYFEFTIPNVRRVFAAVEIVKAFSTYPETLEEYTLKGRKYIRFTQQVNPKSAKSAKLVAKELYTYAAKHLQEDVDSTFCIERETRQDKRNVDKVELLIPLK